MVHIDYLCRHIERQKHFRIDNQNIHQCHLQYKYHYWRGRNVLNLSESKSFKKILFFLRGLTAADGVLTSLSITKSLNAPHIGVIVQQI